jgi:hypothetical protein
VGLMVPFFFNRQGAKDAKKTFKPPRYILGIFNINLALFASLAVGNFLDITNNIGSISTWKLNCGNIAAWIL